MNDRRKETEARRIPPMTDDKMDLLAERILMDMVRQESVLDEFHFAIEYGYWIPRIR